MHYTSVSNSVGQPGNIKIDVESKCANNHLIPAGDAHGDMNAVSWSSDMQYCAAHQMNTINLGRVNRLWMTYDQSRHASSYEEPIPETKR